MKKNFTHPLLILLAFLSFGFLQAQDDFITTWKTDNDGESNNNQITIPTGNGTFAYTVDWGDGSTDTNVYTGDATHTYATAGTYTVSISGDFPHLRNDYNTDSEKLLTVEQWGNQVWESMEKSFYYCSNMIVNASDAPDLTQVTNMNSMFGYAKLIDSNIDNWNVSNVTEMSRMFVGAETFNQDLNSWDVSNVTLMEGMFLNADSFNGNISNWNVSKVTTMANMFISTAFNQDIGNWDVGNVEDMEDMFNGANSFNQDIGTWDVSKVTDMGGMFEEATSFNQDIGSWDVSLVQDMSGMFADAISFNQDIGNWDVSNVISMGTYLDEMGFPRSISGMFEGAAAFNQNIGNWDVSNVLGMGGMFADATAFNQDISGWDVSSVQNMGSVEEFMMPSGFRIGQGMFQGATAFDQDLSTWDIGQVTGMYDMFNNAGLSTANYDDTLIGWNTLDTTAGETQIPVDITFNGGNSTYCSGATARQNLIDTYGWSITDSGEDCTLPFIGKWKTESANEWITVPTNSEYTYAYTVDWGDGSTDSRVYEGDATHRYVDQGTYTVSISGVFPQIQFANDSDRDQFVSIEQWGNQQWASMESSFWRCSNMEYNATDMPDLSLVTNMSSMFSYATKFNGDIGDWDVSNVTNMDFMFYHADAFNQDITDWDVSNVTSMSGMFADAIAFKQDIGKWDVSKVTTMHSMFARATAFNQDLSSWNVSNVTTMEGMFYKATAFDQNIDNWDVGNVTSMIYMFQGATAFNQPIGTWDVSSVTIMTGMFLDATAFDQDLGNWDISKVRDMTIMFDGAALSLKNYDNTLIGWNTLDTAAGETKIPTSITFDGGNSVYCSGETARQDLIDSYRWTITDAGLNCDIVDSDEDGVQDDMDNCADTPAGETVDANGCSDSQKDSDNDGTPDSEDAFPLDADEDTDTDNDGTGDNADTDDDNDGTLDTEDAFPLNANEDTDTDGDGMGDNADTDDDDDGVLDENDICANTPVSETVDAEGCSDSQKDSDFDGISDADDQCPDSPEDESVDANGCADSQKDGDEPGDEIDNGDGEEDSKDDTDTLKVSQAFTPNGDGINDTWTIYGIENYPNSIVRVFNNWGKEVFSAKNYQNNWDGHYKNLNSKLPDGGSYFYQVDLEGDGRVDMDGWLFLAKQ
ncbi:BspA family leucine-rich repeat surface protein [Maribacter sp. MMG018]|uniref:BspA family leucine-rich repeat surface protein n=1 Tax=Maribacter sp. MMG018 TaxID=2822688 RepID=UPI001B39C72D|nr:BspA family leucine-rich repeat surface protein [Maribacter sp. MMG018]MBQ4913918.1 BspA family leucine-rich repeat surface protein [Maribacter sp. MMG018]